MQDVNSIRSILEDIVNHRDNKIELHSSHMGPRTFTACDLVGPDTVCDTVITEQVEPTETTDKVPLIFVEKKSLGLGDYGYIIGIATKNSTKGIPLNHSTLGIPLVFSKGSDFSKYFPVSENIDLETVWNKEVLRGNYYSQYDVLGNKMQGVILLSQREASADLVIACDKWLSEHGFPYDKILLSDRVGEHIEKTREYYEKRGEAWKLLPLAWSLKDKKAELSHRKRNLGTSVEYYHAVNGIHWLTYHGFLEIRQNLGNRGILNRQIEEITTYLDQKKGAHHEVETFGIRDGTFGQLKSNLNNILNATDTNVVDAFDSCANFFRSSLVKPGFAEESSSEFIEEMYRHITGQIYELGIPSKFDERRKALKGATYMDGKPVFHRSANKFVMTIINHFDKMFPMQIDYINIYDVQTERHEQGHTHEVVVKLKHKPRPKDYVIKRLQDQDETYLNYTITKAAALSDLGLSFGEHAPLIIHNSKSKNGLIYEYYVIRNRYDGKPYYRIPKTAYDEDKAVFTGIYMARAAAENCIAFKDLTHFNTNAFGTGKELLMESFNPALNKVLPSSFMCTTIHGVFGWWENPEHKKEDLESTYDFYGGSFAGFLKRFIKEYCQIGSPDDHLNIASKVQNQFITAFKQRIEEVQQTYRSQRETLLDKFNPQLDFGKYNFQEKWENSLWALDHMDANKFADVIIAKLAQGSSNNVSSAK